jgi:site-specific DNA recombinase
VDAATEAGRLLEDLPRLWEEANLSERHGILMTMLEAVYVECQEEKRIVAIKPKPAFRPLFAIATTS